MSIPRVFAAVRRRRLLWPLFWLCSGLCLLAFFRQVRYNTPAMEWWLVHVSMPYKRFMGGLVNGIPVSMAEVVCVLAGAAVLLGICYFRMLSYNREKRYAENLLFLNKTQGIRAWLERQKAAALQKSRDKAARNGQNNGYKIFRCPRCGQQLRVPKGRGRIEILCPKCQAHFVKKS